MFEEMDLTDEQWHQQQLDEQRMLEQDPAYEQWLDQFQVTQE